jgi:hypothetical protein
MHIPDLPTDLCFATLPQTEGALRYSFEAKRAAMRPYIVAHRGWDGALQWRLHSGWFAEKPFCSFAVTGEIDIPWLMERPAAQ